MVTQRAGLTDSSKEEDVLYTYTPNGGAQQDFLYSKMTKKDISYFQGEDIDNYNRRRKSGQLLPYTNWTQYKETGSWNGTSDFTGKNGDVATWPDSHWFIHDALNVGLYQDEHELRSRLSDVPFDNLVQGAASKIYAQGHDSLTFLVELKQVGKMFKNIKRKYEELISGKAFSYSDLAQNWLEYRYGWRILYYDIIDIIEALESLDDSRTRFVQRVGLSISGTDVEETPWQGTSYYGGVLKKTTTWEVSARGSVAAIISPPKFRFNLATTAWELVKFSFLVDWIIDIGMYLESLSFLAVSDDYHAAEGAFVTSRVEMEFVDTFFTDAPGNTWASGSMSFTGHSEAELTTRTPTKISKSLPSIDVNLDIPKVLDLLALLTNPSGSGARI